MENTRVGACFLIKLQVWGPAALLKRDLTQMCPCEISKILRTPILKNSCGRLLIKRYVIKYYYKKEDWCFAFK